MDGGHTRQGGERQDGVFCWILGIWSCACDTEAFNHSCSVSKSCLTLCNPMDSSPPGSSVHGISHLENTGVGCHFLFQGTFPTRGVNPHLLHLLHCRWNLYRWAIGDSTIYIHVQYLWSKEQRYVYRPGEGKEKSEMAPQGYDAWCSRKSENELVGQKHSGQEERLLQRHGKARALGSCEWRDLPTEQREHRWEVWKEAGWDGNKPVHQEDDWKWKPQRREDAPGSRGGAVGHTFLLRKVEERRDPKETKEGDPHMRRGARRSRSHTSPDSVSQRWGAGVRRERKKRVNDD